MNIEEEITKINIAISPLSQSGMLDETECALLTLAILAKKIQLSGSGGEKTVDIPKIMLDLRLALFPTATSTEPIPHHHLGDSPETAVN